MRKKGEAERKTVVVTSKEKTKKSDVYTAIASSAVKEATYISS